MSFADPLQQAHHFADQGHYQEAWRLLQQVLDISPQNHRAWTLRAQLALRLQRKDLALTAVKTALTLAPQDAAAHYVYGRVHKACGDLPAAIDCYRYATLLEPDNADMLTSLGVALRQSGLLQEAIAAYRQALAASPRHAQANHNLANVLETMDVAQDAETYRTRGLEGVLRRLDDLYDKALELRGQGRVAAGMDLLNEALGVAPRAAKLLHAAAVLSNDVGRADKALDFLDRLIQTEPENHKACKDAYQIAVGIGLTDRAGEYADKILRLSPGDDARISRRLLLPAVQESRESIDSTRRAYGEALAELLRGEWSVANPYAVFGNISFFLAYHGQPDRDLQISAASVYAKALPALLYVAPHCRKGNRTQAPRSSARIRIGFISRFLYTHSIGKTTRGLVERLDRERFEIVVIRIAPSEDDETTALIRAGADHVISIDSAAGLTQAHAQIAALELDILFYQDIGMDPMSYSLSFARLAHVQCVSYGHPNTTGVPNMDYFVSNDLYETQEGAQHYSERLFLLHDLPTLAYYYRPTVSTQSASRQDLGLPHKGTIYLCPQVLFKLHPDFDALIAGILERDPLGHVVLIRSPYAEWNDRLAGRFERHLPRHSGRIVFIPAVPSAQFMQMLAASDVMLDTPHFNGMNSSLEAFAVGLPVVTLPTQLQRGRHTRAMYLKMGIADCVACSEENYIDIAVRLGTDADYRRTIRELILKRNGVLYEDGRVVREFERFFFATLSELDNPSTDSP